MVQSADLALHAQFAYLRQFSVPGVWLHFCSTRALSVHPSQRNENCMFYLNFCVQTCINLVFQ